MSKRTNKKTAAASAVEVPTKPTHCLCGCGSEVLRRFRMGHDGRLKGRLLKAWRKGETVEFLGHPNQDPGRLLIDLGWERFMVNSPEEIAARKAEAAKARKEKEMERKAKENRPAPKKVTKPTKPALTAPSTSRVSVLPIAV